MRKNLIYLLLFFLFACKKNDVPIPIDGPPSFHVDTVTSISLWTQSFPADIDTANNFIKDFAFFYDNGLDSSNYTTDTTHWAFESIIYVGKENIVAQTSTAILDGGVVQFDVNENLRGKPLFT